MTTGLSTNLTSDPLFSALTELALDLRWSWNHSTDELWGRLDPELWALTQNPLVVLQTVSSQRIRDVSADRAFSEKVEQLVRRKHECEDASAWFQTAYPGTPLTKIAYFSMEFMLSEALPIYSGGLGNVAGDQLQAASDLGVPVVGIGLLYQQGYFRQEIESDGRVFRTTMEGPEGPPDADGYVLYSAKVPANRPSRDYTARIRPFNPNALVPIEETHILWQK